MPPIPVPKTTAMRMVDARIAQAGLLPRLGGDDRHLLAAVQPAGADAVDLIGRVDRETGDELGRVLLDPVVGDPADPRPTGQQSLPGADDVATERRGGTEAGDDDVGGGRAHGFSS